MLMTDKNGKKIKTGDIVRIEGGYFKADNGTFLVVKSPGDPSWNGSEYCLTKCNKKGVESESKYSTAFWPLMVTVNSRDKSIAARQHNAEHATIEIIGAVKIYELNVTQSRGWNDYKYKELATEKRYQELLTYSHTKVEIISEINLSVTDVPEPTQEPWQMTEHEFTAQAQGNPFWGKEYPITGDAQYLADCQQYHKEAVLKAIAEGKNIPAHVLEEFFEDYPELNPANAQQETVEAATVAPETASAEALIPQQDTEPLQAQNTTTEEEPTTTERAYIFNRETLKIELHFSKPEYLALSQEQKQLLKSNFLFSRYSSAWVSRAKEPNLYHAKQAAAKLGFTQEQRQGDRLSFAEQVERQAERAEARADRFEGYADNAERRAEGLQAEFNRNRKDWSWLTQPIISGHAGSQRFGRQREKVMARYDKGFEEYRKSGYFRDRAATAQATADMKKFQDPIYLDNRIKECKKNIRAMEKNIIHYEEILHSLENHTEDLQSEYFGRYTQEQVTGWIENQLERMEAEIDKQGYMENCLDEIGGVPFSQENIKPGYIVRMRRWGRCEIISAGPVNVGFKILDGGAAGGVLTEAYAAIAEIIEAKEPVKDTFINPFKEGDILCKHRPADNSIYKAYQVIKVTATGVKIQQIVVENGTPLPGQFTGEKAKQKKVVKSKYSDWVGIYDDDWQLHKYSVAQ